MIHARTSEAAPRRAASLVFVLVPFALASILYAPSLANPLLWDDEIHVTAMRDAPPASAFEREAGVYRRPLVLLSYALQARLGAGDAPALHAFNVLVHAINGALLAWLALRLGCAAVVAAAGASLFVAHPLTSAAVAYVSGRTDLMAAFFTLLALHAAASDSRSTHPRAVPHVYGVSGTLVRCVAVAACVACAAASKEPGVLAGPLVAALWWMQGRGARARAAAANAMRDGTAAGARAPVAAAASRSAATPAAATTGARSSGFELALTAIATSLAMLAYVAPSALSSTTAVPLGARLRATGAAFVTFARLIVVPVDLHLDRLASVGATLHLAVGAAVVAAITIVVARFVVRPGRASFAAAAAAVLALPALNVIPVYPAIVEEWVFAGEQMAYLPLAPLCLLLAAGIERGVGLALAAVRVRAAATTTAATTNTTTTTASTTTAALIAVTVAVVCAWWAPLRTAQAALSDPERAYRHTLAHSPSPRACFNLGVALLARGAARDAAETYERCAVLSSHDAGVYVQLGTSWQRAGDRNKAELAYARALELDPRDPLAWSNYATLDASAGLYDEAREKWERALEVEPGFAPALAGLTKLRSVTAPAPALPPPS